MLDTTFNTTGPGAPGVLLLDAIPGDRSAAHTLAIDTGYNPAKIVIVGGNNTYFGGNATKGWVTRLNHDGTQDAITFGSSPVVDTTVGNAYFGVAVVNHDIFVTGANGPGDGGVSTTQSAIVRKVIGSGTSSGSFDSTFGGGNPVLVPLGTGTGGVGEGVVRIGATGSVAVGGFGNGATGQSAITSITSSGIVDPMFGTSGTTTLSFGGQPVYFSNGYQFGMLTTDCEKRMLVSATLIADAGANLDEALVARLLTSGGLDTSFGQGGFAPVGSSFNSSASSLAVEDPVSGGIVTVLRRRGGGLDGQVGLLRFYR
jgi:hypothetical protein